MANLVLVKEDVVQTGIGPFKMESAEKARQLADYIAAIYADGYRAAQEEVRKAIGAVGPFGF